MKINSLVLGAGTQGLITVKSLHDCGHRVVLITSEKNNYADASRYVDRLYRNLGTTDDCLLSLIKEVVRCEQIDVIIPMGDADAEFLCKYAGKIPPSAKMKLPTYENFLRGYDKNRLMALCREKGYPHPLSYDLSNVALDSKEIREFPYPAMLKPNCTTGCRGMVEVHSYDELLARFPELHELYGEYHLQKFIKAGGRQVKIQVYIDEHKHLVAHSVQHKMRWYPNKGGSNTCAMSIECPDMVNICYQILKDIDWIGFADFDTIENPDTGELLIMEINPRLPACIKGSIVAGINWPEIIVNDALGLPQKQYKYKTGVVLRHLGLDTLWFLKAKNRWSVEPNWFKLVGSNIYYQDASSWSDPMPFIKGTWHNIAKLFDPDFKKAKQG